MFFVFLPHSRRLPPHGEDARPHTPPASGFFFWCVPVSLLSYALCPPGAHRPLLYWLFRQGFSRCGLVFVTLDGLVSGIRIGGFAFRPVEILRPDVSVCFQNTWHHVRFFLSRYSGRNAVSTPPFIRTFTCLPFVTSQHVRIMPDVERPAESGLVSPSWSLADCYSALYLD